MLKNKIKIGYVSSHNPLDRKASSGTTYKIAERLQNSGAIIEWIPVKVSLIFRLFEIFFAVSNILLKRNVKFSFTKLGGWLKANTLNKKIIESCDIIFIPFEAPSAAYIKTDRKIIYLSDATFPAMVNYYFHNLPDWNIKSGIEIERRAMKKATAIILSSSWAAESAINDLSIDNKKINIIEFGANIDNSDIQNKTSKNEGKINLLFLGVDWIRKGGDIAVDACEYLNKKGIDAKLNIVGINNLDPKISSKEHIINHGFLNKNNKADYNKLCDLINNSDCLILPTIAECSAIVFAESSAYGNPIFSHDTGGVSNYVINGQNGYLLPMGSTGEDFGEKIKECIETGELREMINSSIYIYNSKLNWNVWQKKVEKIIDNII